ncbi:MAG: hypothetical protein IJ997_02725 [Mycoplasmataceae bacterium]|nr:hypothetical protein [Mycoplasmataceae bacterium]
MNLFLLINLNGQCVISISFEKNISISKIAQILGYSRKTITNNLNKCKTIEMKSSNVKKHSFNCKICDFFSKIKNKIIINDIK